MGKTNWLREEISNPRRARYFNKRARQGIRTVQQVLRAVAGKLRPVSTFGCAVTRSQTNQLLNGTQGSGLEEPIHLVANASSFAARFRVH